MQLTKVSEITKLIDEAIEKFVKEQGSIQETITLPFEMYQAFLREAKSTELGRSFLRYGFVYCGLPVFCGGGEIRINEYFDPKTDKSTEEIIEVNKPKKGEQ